MEIVVLNVSRIHFGTTLQAFRYVLPKCNNNFHSFSAIIVFFVIISRIRYRYLFKQNGEFQIGFVKSLSVFSLIFRNHFNNPLLLFEKAIDTMNIASIDIFFLSNDNTKRIECAFQFCENPPNIGWQQTFCCTIYLNNIRLFPLLCVFGNLH